MQNGNKFEEYKCRLLLIMEKKRINLHVPLCLTPLICFNFDASLTTTYRINIIREDKKEALSYI